MKSPGSVTWSSVNERIMNGILILTIVFTLPILVRSQDEETTAGSTTTTENETTTESFTTTEEITTETTAASTTM